MDSNKKIGVLIGIVAAIINSAISYLGKITSVGYNNPFRIITPLVFLIGLYYLWKSKKINSMAYSITPFALTSLILLNTNLSKGVLIFNVFLTWSGIYAFFATGRQKGIIEGTCKAVDYKPASAKEIIVAAVISFPISLLVFGYIGTNYLPKPNTDTAPLYAFAFFGIFFLLLLLTIAILRKIK